MSTSQQTLLSIETDKRIILFKKYVFIQKMHWRKITIVWNLLRNVSTDKHFEMNLENVDISFLETYVAQEKQHCKLTKSLGLLMPN